VGIDAAADDRGRRPAPPADAAALGQPRRRTPCELPFGGVVEAEGTLGAYTTPLRVGWHLDGDAFESGGEFFRVTVDEARYR
jgi:hypothetical protein